MNKIDLMHKLFGRKTGLCKNCEHFIHKEHDKIYRKCEIYGNTNGEGTDWKANNIACGLYPDVQYRGRIVAEIANKQHKNKKEETLEGQMQMEVNP